MKKISVYLSAIYPYIFAILFFILLMYVETSTMYAFQNTSFSVGFEQFMPYIYYSGGILEYIGLFFTEIIKFNVSGAFLYAIITLVSIFLYKQFLIKTGLNGNILLLTTLLPFVFVISLTFNQFHSISINLKILTGLLFLNLLTSRSNQGIVNKIIAILLLIASWYLCGLPLFIIVFFNYVIYSISNNKFKGHLMVFLLSIISIYILNMFIFYRPAEIIFKELIDPRSQIPNLLLYTYILFIIFPIIVFIKYKISISPILQLLLILVFGFLLGNKLFNKTNYIIGKIMVAGNASKYNEVLQIRDNTSINSRIISNYTNIALLNKGVLLDRMFKYNQELGKQGIYPSYRFDNYNAFSNMKLCFDLGLMNQSIRWAIEASTFFGYNFEILKHLILSYLVIDNLKAAEKYYVIMDNILFHNKEKKRIRRMLDNYINNQPDKLILEKRKLMPDRDYLSTDDNEEHNFAWALRGSNNFRAFELYTALCLINYDMSRLEEIIAKFRQFRSRRLPIHFQEAICLYNLEQNRSPFRYDFQIDQNIIQRCVMFYQTLGNYNNNLQAAKNELSQNFTNTYWYYLNYLSPQNMNEP